MQARISQADVTSTGTQPPPAQVRMAQMGSHAGNSGSVYPKIVSIRTLRNVILGDIRQLIKHEVSHF